MNDIQVARGLGWFSIGLGAAELFAPNWLAEKTGVNQPGLVRAFGARELASGIAVLAQPLPAAALWSRVAGDALDVAVLGRAMRRRTARRRAAIALAAVAGVTLLDILFARRLSRL